MDPVSKHSRLLGLLGVILVVAALYFAKAVLILFAIAFLLAFLLAPLLTRIERLGLPRIPAVGVVMAFALAIAVGLVWVVVGQTNDLVDKLPEYRHNLRDKFSTVSARIRSPIQKAQQTVAEITKETAESGPAESRPLQEVKVAEGTDAGIDGIIGPIGQVLDVLGALGIIILLSAVMLIQKEDMRDRLIRLAGAGQLNLTTRAFDEASAKVSRYLLITTVLNAVHGVLIGTGLFFLGIPNALLWGLLSGLLRFIPYIGPWIAAAFPIALALAVFPGWTVPLLTIGLVLMLELVSNNVLEPWLYGTRTGISPGALIIAAVFWTWIWGPAGLFLATPLTVCLAVMGKYVPPLRFLHVLLGDEPVLPPEAKLYQRLLAGDTDEAWDICSKELGARTKAEIYDQVLVPALALAERERHAGTLDAGTFESVARAMRDLVDEVDECRLPKAASKDEGAPPEEPPAPAEAAPVIPALIIAAEDDADAVVASMADKLLRRLGYASSIVIDALTGELPNLVEEKGAKLILISNLPPSGFAQVRYICKRLAPRLEDLHVIVGIWGSNLDAAKARERLPEHGSIDLVNSLAEAVRHADELHRSLVLQPETSLPKPPATVAGGAPRAKSRRSHA